MAPFLEEKVQFKLPVKNECVQASVPVPTSYFYYDAILLSSAKDKVRLCEKNELPIFRRDLLNKELDIDLLRDWERIFETMQRLCLYKGGNTIVSQFTQLNWYD